MKDNYIPVLPIGWSVFKIYRLTNEKDYHCTLVNDYYETSCSANGNCFENSIINCIDKIARLK